MLTYTTAELAAIVELNRKSSEGEPGGKRAILRDADLRWADLSDANLSDADLRGADLTGADLTGADLSLAILSNANLSNASLSNASLSNANLSNANLSNANLSGAYLSGAYLSGAYLSGAYLSGANLSGAIGMPTAAEFFAQFETDTLGVIVYKAIGQTTFTPPTHWVLAPGSFLTETVNPDRATTCGSGINFGTRQYCAQNYGRSDLWRCRINWLDLADVVVPFGTDGKARCSRLELIEIVKP